MGSSWNGLARNKRPNMLSKKKVLELNNQVDERVKLALRCGGKPEHKLTMIRFNDGTKALLHSVKCVGGVCEICKMPAQRNEMLEPHELLKRSAGGKVSCANSKMCHHRCHPISKPQLSWIKKAE